MRHLLPVAALLAAAPFLSLPARAADAPSTNAPAAKPPAAATPSPEVIAKMKDVFQQFNDAHYDAALSKLDEVDKLQPADAELANLRGAIYVKQEKWQMALDAFNRALQIDPKYFPARFNLGEVSSLQKKYPDARAVWEKLRAEDPKNELIQYKIYLTYLLEGNLTEAKARLDKFDFTGNTPAYYFAQAAWSYNQQKTDDGNSYVMSAARIFPAATNTMFAESLIDAGFIKRTAPAPAPAAK